MMAIHRLSLRDSRAGFATQSAAVIVTLVQNGVSNCPDSYFLHFSPRLPSLILCYAFSLFLCTETNHRLQMSVQSICFSRQTISCKSLLQVRTYILLRETRNNQHRKKYHMKENNPVLLSYRFPVHTVSRWMIFLIFSSRVEVSSLTAV